MAQVIVVPVVCVGRMPAPRASSPPPRLKHRQPHKQDIWIPGPPPGVQAVDKIASTAGIDARSAPSTAEIREGDYTPRSRWDYFHNVACASDRHWSHIAARPNCFGRLPWTRAPVWPLSLSLCQIHMFLSYVFRLLLIFLFVFVFVLFFVGFVPIVMFVSLYSFFI